MWSRLKSLYRVDNVPLWLQPLYLTVSGILGFFQFLYFCVLCGATCRVEFSPQDPRTPGSRYIYACWHDQAYALFTSFRRIDDLVILNHPYWYMKSTHMLLRYFGVRRMFMGSTGNSGREAVDQLIRELNSSESSTFINPDGPAGPVHEIHKGIYHVALQTGLPILPLSFSISPAVRAPSWDRKWFPLPFCKFKIKVAEPIQIMHEDFSQYEPQLRCGLDGIDRIDRADRA